MLPGLPNGVLAQFTLLLNGSSVLATSPTAANIFNLTRLSAFMTYSAQVRWCTAVGCTLSNASTFQTLPSRPELVAAPLVTALGDTSIEVRWSEPALPNGVISGYEVVAGITEPYIVLLTVFASSRRSVVDGVQPATLYTIRIRATNQAGSTVSNATQVTTLDGAPAGVDAPEARNISSTSIHLTWDAPAVANGVITRYLLNRDGQEVHNQSADEELSFMDSGLTPFTTYAYSVTACTSRLCATGNETMILTSEDVPSGLLPPSLVVLSSSVISILWQPPQAPNGRITYTIHLFGPVQFVGVMGDVLNGSRVFTGIRQLVRQFNVTNLLPHHSYHVLLMAATSAGGTNSSLSSPARTLQAGERISKMRQSAYSHHLQSLQLPSYSFYNC